MFIKVKPWDGEPVRYIQDKLDGYFITIERNSTIRVLTRKKDVDLWPRLKRIRHIANPIEELPGGTVIMGELYWNGPATSVLTLLNSADKRLKFSAFAMPIYNGVDVTSDYIRVISSLGDLGFLRPNTRTFAVGDRTIEEIITTLKSIAKHNKKEGYILKNYHLGGWYKVKVTKTVDCIVKSYTTSKSKTYKGGLKAVQVGLFNDWRILASVGNGFTKEYRMRVNRPSLIGRVCEVEYDALAANGCLKFPRFLRWRGDKTLEECKEL